MSELIRQYWNKRFPKSPMVSQGLREQYKDIWFRIHVLPGSKRHAETKAEFEEVLYRHNTLCTDLFKKSRSSFLLLTEGSFSKDPVEPSYINKRPFPMEYVATIPMTELEPGYTSYWHIWSHAFTWTPAMFNKIFRKVAEWKVVNLMLLDTNTHRLYCPYEGGADVFLASPAERDTYKAKYKDWLSPHPSGL